MKYIFLTFILCKIYCPNNDTALIELFSDMMQKKEFYKDLITNNLLETAKKLPIHIQDGIKANLIKNYKNKLFKIYIPRHIKLQKINLNENLIEKIKNTSTHNISYEIEKNRFQATVIAFFPDKKMVLTGHKDGSICIQDTASCEIISRLPYHYGWVDVIYFLPDGKRFITGSNYNEYAIWDLSLVESIIQDLSLQDMLILIPKM